MDPMEGVPVVSSGPVQYLACYMTLELTTNKGGDHPIRTIFVNQNNGQTMTLVQALQIPISVGRSPNVKHITLC